MRAARLCCSCSCVWRLLAVMCGKYTLHHLTDQRHGPHGSSGSDAPGNLLDAFAQQKLKERISRYRYPSGEPQRCLTLVTNRQQASNERGVRDETGGQLSGSTLSSSRCCLVLLTLMAFSTSLLFCAFSLSEVMLDGWRRCCCCSVASAAATQERQQRTGAAEGEGGGCCLQAHEQ